MINKFFGQFDPPVDKVLRGYFPDYNYKGVMLDIGACDPVWMSNSNHFELNGWEVFCFEPNPSGQVG